MAQTTAASPGSSTGPTDRGSPVSGVAGRYATALYELALETGALDEVGEGLRRFEAMIASSPELADFLRNPVFSAEDQSRAVAALLESAGIGGLAANFVKVVASKRRLFLVQPMIAAFKAMVAQAAGIVRAEVTVAHPPSETALAAIREALSESAGGRIDLQVKVDPSIIGGLVVKMGSRMIDASLKTKLNAIRLAMKEAG